MSLIQATNFKKLSMNKILFVLLGKSSEFEKKRKLNERYIISCHYYIIFYHNEFLQILLIKIFFIKWAK